MFPWLYEHILTVIIISPFIGIFILLVMPRKYEDASSEVALISTMLTLFLSIIMLGLFKADVRFAFTETRVWLPAFGVGYNVGIDGLSSWLVVLTAAVMLLAVLFNWRTIKNFRKEAFASLLILEAGLLGTFCALDVLLMYVFMEVSVIFLGISYLFFRGPAEEFFSRYIGFMSLSSLMLLTVIIFIMTVSPSMDLASVEQIAFSKNAGIILLILLLAASAVRMGLFPFNSWLSKIDGESIDFLLIPAGLLFIAAGYFLYRLMPTFAVSVSHAHTAITWAVVSSILITALSSTAQKNLVSMILYVVRIQFGFVMLGIVSLSLQGMVGSGFQMITSTISLSAASLIFLFLRGRKINLGEQELSGAFAGAPLFAVSFLLLLISLAGLPGLAHFPGLFMIWMGLFREGWVLTMAAILAIVFVSFRLVQFVGAALYSEPDKAATEKVSLDKAVLVLAFALIIVGIGLFPDIILEDIKQGAEAAWKIFSHQI